MSKSILTLKCSEDECPDMLSDLLSRIHHEVENNKDDDKVAILETNRLSELNVQRIKEYFEFHNFRVVMVDTDVHPMPENCTAKEYLKSIEENSNE